MLDQIDSIDRVEQMHDIYDNNKVIILIAGYETAYMIDTGTGTSTINRILYEIIPHYTRLTKYKDYSVNIPLKINRVLLEAILFILDIEHIHVIIGCNLLNAMNDMNARIYFKSHRLIAIENQIRIAADVTTSGLLREL